MEWFNSIGNWFVEHYEGLMAFVSSSNFVAFVANIVLLVKTVFGLKANNAATKTLNDTLVNNAQLTNDMAELKKTNEALVAENAELKSTLEAMKTEEDLILSKLSAILDVQSLVYATIKDEPTRVAVLNILANAKYVETNQRNKLKEELVNLKEMLAEKTAEAVEQVSDAVEKATAIVENVPQRS